MVQNCRVCGGIYRYETGGYGGVCNTCEERPKKRKATPVRRTHRRGGAMETG